MITPSLCNATDGWCTRAPVTAACTLVATIRNAERNRMPRTSVIAAVAAALLSLYGHR